MIVQQALIYVTVMVYKNMEGYVMNKKKYLKIGCIILGIWIMLVPFAKESVENRRQQKILTQWKQEMEQIENREETAETEKKIEKRKDAKGNLGGVVGILRIPVIELEQPILKGATEHNLNQSVATIEPTGLPGAEGNFAIAGHNSRTYGRHFNRLAELEIGDKLFVDTKMGNYAYQVTDVYVAEAEDVWVLGDTADRAEITLITCHYPKEGKKQRLIIKGILQEK